MEKAGDLKNNLEWQMSAFINSQRAPQPQQNGTLGME